MSSSLNAFWAIQTALIFCVFILSAVIVTAIQVLINKKAGDYSSDILGYNPWDVLQHVDITNFMLYLLTGYFFTRPAPTNHAYIRAKYPTFLGWLIVLSPGFLSIVLAFVLYCLSNIFMGSFATDLAIAHYRMPLLEVLPQILPNYSSFKLVLLTIVSITVICQILTGVIMIINYFVNTVIIERFNLNSDDDATMQMLLTFTITILLLTTLLSPAVSLILQSFFYIKYFALSLLKVLV